MSDFLTYKKISDLEEVEEVLSGATVPVLDGDGVVKRISAEGIGGIGGNKNVVLFRVKNDALVGPVDYEKPATGADVVEAFYNGTAKIAIWADLSYGLDNGGTAVTYGPRPIDHFFVSGGYNYAVTASGKNFSFAPELDNKELVDLIQSYYGE